MQSFAHLVDGMLANEDTNSILIKDAAAGLTATFYDYSTNLDGITVLERFNTISRNDGYVIGEIPADQISHIDSMKRVIMREEHASMSVRESVRRGLGHYTRQYWRHSPAFAPDEMEDIYWFYSPRVLMYNLPPPATHRTINPRYI